jgi:PAS domain-containing protein
MLNGFILHTIIEKMNHPMVICDSNGDYVFWNESAKIILDFNQQHVERHKALSKWAFFDSKGIYYNPDNFPMRRAVINGEETIKERMLCINNENKTEMYIDVDAFPVYDENKLIVAAVASFTDVSKIVKMGNILDEVITAFTKMKQLIEKSFYRK